jgi:CRP/FNR family transcriptional regulator
MHLDPAAFVAEPELIRTMDRQAIPISCTEDLVLFRQGDAPMGLYILKSGEVDLTMSSASGKEIVSTKASAGALLGLPGLIGNEPYSLTAVALAGAKLGFVARDSFTALMRNEPSMAFKILQVLAAEVRSARSAILQR